MAIVNLKTNKVTEHKTAKKSAGKATSGDKTFTKRMGEGAKLRKLLAEARWFE